MSLWKWFGDKRRHESQNQNERYNSSHRHASKTRRCDNEGISANDEVPDNKTVDEFFNAVRKRNEDDVRRIVEQHRAIVNHRDGVRDILSCIIQAIMYVKAR